jgi:type II secretion system protein I
MFAITEQNQITSGRQAQPEGNSAVGGNNKQAGFTLMEVLVALAIMSMAMLSLIGLRSESLVQATEARNLRVAAALATQILSEVQAGMYRAYDLKDEDQSVEGFEKFPWRLLVGEGAIQEELSYRAEREAESGDQQLVERQERMDWLQKRSMSRKSRQRGITTTELEDQQLEPDETPDDQTFEEIAIIVDYFAPSKKGDSNDFILRGRATTLALNGLTSEQAEEQNKSEGTGIGNDKDE